MFRIIVTVFDSVLLALLGWVASTSEERRTFGVSLFMIFIMLMNIACIWGNWV